MKHIDKVKTIQFIRPNAQFVLTGDKLDWLDETQTKPTDEEIKAGFVAYQKSVDDEIERQAEAKTAAQAKLAALGLTVEDLQALGL